MSAQAEMVSIDFAGAVVIPGASGVAMNTALSGEAVLNMGDYSAASVNIESVASDPVYAMYGVTAIRHVEFAASSRNLMGVTLGGRVYVALDPIVRVSEFLRKDGSVSSNTVYLESQTWSAAQGLLQVPMSLQLSNVRTSQALHADMLDGLNGFGSLGIGAVDATQGFVVSAGFNFRITEASVLATAVPEPGHGVLGALGLAALCVARRRHLRA
jgi:hypothetical protein